MEASLGENQFVYPVEVTGDTVNQEQAPHGAETGSYGLEKLDVVQALVRRSKAMTSLLSQDQEVELSGRVQDGLMAQEKLDAGVADPDLEVAVRDGIRAEELFVAGNALLVISRARRFMSRRNVPPENLGELVSEGLYGLAQAVRSYKPEKAKFSTHATSLIDKYIISSDPYVVGSAVGFSRNDRESVLPSLFATYARLNETFGRTPSMQELSDAFNEYHANKRAASEDGVPSYLIMDPGRALALLGALNWRSLSAPGRIQGSEWVREFGSIGDSLEDESHEAQTEWQVVSAVFGEQIREPLLIALGQLPERQQRLMYLTFQLGLDPDEGKVLNSNGLVSPGLIAKVLGIRQQQVSQIRNRVLASLSQDDSLLEIWAQLQ